ncbi:sodium/proline symporter [Flavobacteriaceae bacterium 3-367]|uniref:sodium/proline symporter n=1 Tax=Eudoraea algarum TaxID=3417568 RepID=UPI0032892D29
MTTKLLVLSIYFLILFLIGIFASKKVKSLSDYYVGGKKVGYWAAAFSARATGESGWLLLGLTGMGAIAGISAYWVVLGEVLGVAISWFFMAKPFKRESDSYKAITIPDYLDGRFKPTSNLLRSIAATALSVFVIIYVSAQIDTTGKAFESLIGIDYFTGAIVGFLVVTAYIFVGGFLAAVWSDFFQGLMMFFGLIALPLIAWFSIESGSEFVNGLRAIDPRLLNLWGTSHDPWINAFTILGFAMIGLGFLGSPQIYVRFMAIKNEQEINKGRWVAILFTLLTDAAAVTIGLLGRYLFTETGQDPLAVLGIGGENVLIVMVEHLLPLTLVGVYIAIVLSAIMSTIDSLLIVASSAITRDFYQKIFHPNLANNRLGRLSRVVTLLMALLALGLSMAVAVLSPDRTIFWFIIFGWSGIAATFCPVIILSLFWKNYSEKGAIASMVTGFLCVPLFKFVVQEIAGIGVYFEKLDVLAPSFLLAMLAGWVFTKLYPAKKVSKTS